MRLVRAVRPVLVLALAATGLASPALAKPAPKPACRLVTDAEGDARRRPVGTVPVYIMESSALDLTGADVATGKKTVVIVVRVKTTDVSTDPYAPLGFGWSFQFKIKDTAYAVQRTRSIGNDGQASYRNTFTVGGSESALPAGSKTSMDATSYTWVLPRSAIASLKKPKQVLKEFTALSTILGGNLDAAGSNLTYADQYKSCLNPA